MLTLRLSHHLHKDTLGRRIHIVAAAYYVLHLYSSKNYVCK